LRFKHLRLIREFSSAIRRADLSSRQKLACHFVMAKWIWYIRAVLIRELLLPLYVNQRPTRLTLWLRSMAGSKRVSEVPGERGGKKGDSLELGATKRC
jgi:hypothetical protein